MIRWILRKFNPAGLYDYTLQAYNKAVEDLKLCLEAEVENHMNICNQIEKLQDKGDQSLLKQNKIEELRSKLRVI